MKTGKILINFYLTKKIKRGSFEISPQILATFLVCHYFIILLRITNSLSLSSTSSIIFITQKLDVTAKNWKKQIAFLISALKSTLIKKEK